MADDENAECVDGHEQAAQPHNAAPMLDEVQAGKVFDGQAGAGDDGAGAPCREAGVLFGLIGGEADEAVFLAAEIGAGFADPQQQRGDGNQQDDCDDENAQSRGPYSGRCGYAREAVFANRTQSHKSFLFLAGRAPPFFKKENFVFGRMGPDAMVDETDSAVFGKSLYGGSHEPVYSGVMSFMRRRLTRALAGVDVAVWGIPFDAAVSNRPGARFGPQAIRRASAIMEGDPQYPFLEDPFANLAVIDYGDCTLDFGVHGETPGRIITQARPIIDAGLTLLSMGGDHFVTWPLLQAHAEKFGPMALVQFDAHQDTWLDAEERLDHGSFVVRAVRAGIVRPERSIQIGIRTHAPEDCGLEILYGDDVARLGVDGVITRILSRVGDAKTYLSFDIDCMDPAFAPGTGTPVAGGLSSREALMIVGGLGALDIVGGDVVEVAPAYDHADITSIAAAAVLQRYLGLLARKKK